MNELIRSVSGIRGIWGQSLFPDTVSNYSAAFGTYVNAGKVVIGRDTRTTGETLKNASIAGLISAGCEVFDIGVCPTPTCQLMVEELHAVGGIVITASHNPANWNGLKFLDSNGQFLDELEHRKFLDIFDNNKIKRFPLSQHKFVHDDEELNKQAIETHISRIMSYINTDSIKKRPLKVVLDACNGAGSKVIIPFLEKLGCQIIKLNCLENGIFPRGPEPTPENLSELCAKVKKNGADIGFAVDPDADRLGIVSEKGEALNEEMTLPLVALNILQKKDGLVVTNLSTSMAVDFVAQKFNSRVIRTKIGEANLVSTMKTLNCYVGGEGHGGVIVPEIHYARDATVGIGIILELISESKKFISKLSKLIPKFYIVKRKITCPASRSVEIINKLKSESPDQNIDTTDGLRIDWGDSWLHIRKSGTEDIIRVIAESKSEEEANNLVEESIGKIKRLLD
jgi:phosphomannomutase